MEAKLHSQEVKYCSVEVMLCPPQCGGNAEVTFHNVEVIGYYVSNLASLAPTLLVKMDPLCLSFYLRQILTCDNTDHMTLDKLIHSTLAIQVL